MPNYFNHTRTGFVVLAASLLVLLSSGQAGMPALAVGPDAILTVDSLEDTNNPDNVLTLREALLIATGNLVGGLTPGEQAQTQTCTFNGAGDITGGCGAGIAETIRFAPSLGIFPVIRLTAPLPALDDSASITIDGTGVAPIVDAAGAGASYDALVITSGGNTVSGIGVVNSPRDGVSVSGSGNVLSNVVIRGSGRHAVLVAGGLANQVQDGSIGAVAGDVACVAGNGGSGIYIAGSAQNTVVSGNLVGCNAGDGITIDGAKLSQVLGNSIGVAPSGAKLANGYGVALFGAATGNVIGSLSAGGPNVIGGNTNTGVYVVGTGTAGNSVNGNLVGLRAGGLVATANGGAGVHVGGGASGNAVRGNTISGNAREGVVVDGVANTVIAGNRVGTNAPGIAAIPNGMEGIVLQSGATNSTIGGPGAADRNIISGNSNAGIVIRDSGTKHNVVDGNNIGIDVSGSIRLGNGQAGVAIFDGSENRVGSDSDTISQFITGNAREGVYLEIANGTVIGRSNAIGTGWNLSSAIGNTREGVLISNSSNVVARPGLVAGNGLAGMALTGAASNNDILAPYESGANGGLPVDLGNNGATANDTGDSDSGPNGLLNYPVITTRAGGTVSGTACGSCSVLVYVSYANPAATGGKAEFLTQVAANGAGAWSAAIPVGVPLTSISAVACTAACGPGSATSELAPVTAITQVRTVEFFVPSSTVSEGETAQVQVRLTTSDGLPSSIGVVVQYATANGTALAGVDYTAKSGTVAFLGGSANGETRSIPVSTLADSAEDPGETLTITILTPTNARLGDIVIHTVTIGLPAPVLPFHAVIPALSKDD